MPDGFSYHIGRAGVANNLWEPLTHSSVPAFFDFPTSEGDTLSMLIRCLRQWALEPYNHNLFWELTADLLSVLKCNLNF